MRHVSSVCLSVSIVVCILLTPVQNVFAGEINGNDVLIIGDSFFAMTGEIKQFLEQYAREEGVIDQNESFRSGAVSGALISGISEQYSNASPKPKWVIMDAGGNDCLRGDPQSAVDEVQPLLDKMRDNGTEKVLWMRYPEPQGMFAGNLKPNLDALMPQVESICAASTNPEVLWVDLRPVWEMNGSYTSDGIHPTTEGSRVTAVAFWNAIKESDFFDLEQQVALQPFSAAQPQGPLLRGKTVENRTLLISAYQTQPSRMSLRLMTLSGRTVLSYDGQMTGCGLQTVSVPIGKLVPGAYCCRIRAGRELSQSMLLVR